MDNKWISVIEHYGSSNTYYTATVCGFDGPYSKGEGSSIAEALDSCVKAAVERNEIPNKIEIYYDDNIFYATITGWDYSQAERIANALVGMQ
jgi:hypothetical protein